jgi:pimeloyl-ACP methyl ester carboxylesterase
MDMLRGFAIAGALFALGATSVARAAQSGFVEAPDGVPLCVYETGRPDAPALLFIHGFSQSYAVFKLQYQSDLARDFRIVAFDLRGHGCSGKPWKESAYATPDIWAADVRAVMTAKKLIRPVIVGWSYGGYIIADYVRAYGTADVAGLVLIGSNGGLLPPPTDPQALARQASARAAALNTSPDIEAGIAGGHAFVKLMSAHPLPPDLAEIMFVTNQMLPAYARRAMSGRSLQNDDVVPEFRAPTLFVIGDKDLSQSPAVMAKLAASLPNAKLSVYPDAGHAAFADAPERFDAELRAFAQSVQLAGH